MKRAGQESCEKRSWPVGDARTIRANRRVCQPTRPRHSGHDREENLIRLCTSCYMDHSQTVIRTDHFQTVASRSVAAQHQSSGLKRSLNHRHLALVLAANELSRLAMN